MAYIAGMPVQSVPDAVEVFTALVKLLVDDPKNVTVTATQGLGGVTLLRAEVASVEAGRLIGVSGRTARALRVILTNIGLAQSVRYSLDIVERPPQMR